MMTTRIQLEKIDMPMARLGPPSNLPRFQWQQPMPNRPTPPNFGLSEEESRHGFNWGAESILPYQVSDDYDREIAPSALDCIAIDNGRLRALVAPSLGGRLIELRDLETGRDLVFRNPVFQPANLAALNAWFSGGIEWNGLIPGHTPFTCAPVFAGLRDTPQGPILRLYEFDRIVEAIWQIDLFMPAESARLFAHGRIVNTLPEERLAYWWTNIAAPMAAGTRVLSPADYSVEHIWPGNNLGRCDFPRPPQDPSYPEHWHNATSVFFRAPDAPRLFVTALDSAGYGLLQSSTREMRGRKFFYFGTAVGGQNWMDYLARPGEGHYLEIQSGITPTQNQRFALGPREELDWTELFMPLQLDPAQAHNPDYAAAVGHAAAILDATVPADELAHIDAFLREQARLPLDRLVSHGERWGARQELLLGHPLASGLDFTVAAPDDFWDALARGGAIAPHHLEALPQGVAVSPLWVERLGDGSASWLHAVMRAVAALDRGEREAAARHVAQSLARKPNWLAYRLAALLAPDSDTALDSYRKAWALGDAPPELAVEIAQYLMAAGRPAELAQFVGALPAALQNHERIILARAVVAADAGEMDALEGLLMSRRFATIREGETLLSDLWVRLRRGRLAASLGRDPDAAGLRRDLAAHPLPRALDLRMHALDES